MTTATVEFDPFSDEYFNDPTEVYRQLRDDAPVYFNEHYGFYALSRFADVVAAHRDWQGFSSAHGIELSTLSKDDPALIASYRSIIMMDPPEHDRFRALVSRVFTPRAVAALEPMIREVIVTYLDALDDADAFDAVADFSAPFPVEIISRMLGVPAGERQQIRHWLDLSLHRDAGDLEPTKEGMRAMFDMGLYFHELSVEKRSNPSDDMLSRLTQVRVERTDGTETGLDDQEIAGFATLLGGAGAETVTKLVGNAVVLFSRHPDQWRAVREDPEKVPAADRGDPALRAPVAVPGPLLGRGPGVRGRNDPGRAPGTAHHRRGDARSARVRPNPIGSTSSANRTWRSASATACTAASAPRSPGWRAASPSKSWPGGGHASTSTRPGSNGSTCRTSPATRRSRCTAADRTDARPALHGAGTDRGQ